MITDPYLFLNVCSIQCHSSLSKNLKVRGKISCVSTFVRHEDYICHKMKTHLPVTLSLVLVMWPVLLFLSNCPANI